MESGDVVQPPPTADMEPGGVAHPPPIHGGVSAPLTEEKACLTYQSTVKISFLWTITNFSLCRQNTTQALLSSTFAAGERKNVAWRLKLYPRGTSEDCGDFLSLFLVSYNARRVCAKATFAIIDAKNEEVNTKQTRTRLFSRKGAGWGFPKFISRASLRLDARGILPADSLTLKCELTALESSTTSFLGPRNSMNAIPECRLSEDLGWLLESSCNSDVTLRVDGGSIDAHRSILAARSPVFRAMFAHPMQEQVLGEVVVTDVEYDVLAALLWFVYTGRVPDIEKPRQLFVAADKYQLERLKAACEVALLSRLTVGTAVDTLLLADSYSARTLRRRTLDFVCAHIGHVMETDGWKDIRENRADLVEEALLRFAGQHAEPPAKRSRDSLELL